jgi:hypothetical protein
MTSTKTPAFTEKTIMARPSFEAIAGEGVQRALRENSARDTQARNPPFQTLPLPSQEREPPGNPHGINAVQPPVGTALPTRYQSILRVTTIKAARITNNNPEPSTNALSSETSRP